MQLVHSLKRPLLFPLLILLLQACNVSKPPGVTTVEPFDGERYMGTWFEIARLDHSFERGLNNVTASYTLDPDGSIDVLNKGFNTASGEWEQATGNAEFVEGANKGRLKVSFFGPFYAGYNVIAIDADYQNALVTGEDRETLWLLSRTPDMPQGVKEQYLEKARDLGYNTEQLIWVEHDR